ncbi:MAG TPA: hypothetical protein VMB47_17280 [Candidatus Aquilonibacter sp.]|nr:hypothetical protein [Candidatus Aquilonibacter sp.]
MSRSNSFRAFATWAGVAGAFCACASALASSQAFPRKNPARLAHEFLLTAYPDLPPKDFLKLSLEENIGSPWTQFFRVSLDVVPLSTEEEINAKDSFTLDGRGGRIPPPTNTPVLTGFVDFDGGERIQGFGVSGPLSNSDKNDAIQHLIQSHPEWTNEMDYEALEKAGARFGPSDEQAFVQSIHIEKYRPFLGQLKVKSVTFEGPQERHQGTFGIMYWEVRAEARLHGGPVWEYSLLFEPFDGKLIGLWRIDGAIGAANKK